MIRFRLTACSLQTRIRHAGEVVLVKNCLWYLHVRRSCSFYSNSVVPIGYRQLIYGSGLRVMVCARWRVKDVEYMNGYELGQRSGSSCMLI